MIQLRFVTYTLKPNPNSNHNPKLELKVEFERRIRVWVRYIHTFVHEYDRTLLANPYPKDHPMRMYYNDQKYYYNGKHAT
jgi:hypothetical protein